MLSLWLGLYQVFFNKKQHVDVEIHDEIVTSSEESWFVYSPKKKTEVDKYISSR